jgi:hypothetical protein
MLMESTLKYKVKAVLATLRENFKNRKGIGIARSAVEKEAGNYFTPLKPGSSNSAGSNCFLLLKTTSFFFSSSINSEMIT